MITEYKLDDIVQMKKDRPCKKSHYFKIIRLGADVKLKCQGCGAIVIMDRPEFERKCKRNITNEESS